MINGLCWPGMVHNQRQLFIIVSDWGSYLGSHFPHCDSWDLDYVMLPIALLASWFGCALLFYLVSFDLLKYVEHYARCALVQSL